jgi:hypothetical protein
MSDNRGGLGLIPSDQPELARQLLDILKEAKKAHGIAKNDDRDFVDYPLPLQAKMALDMIASAGTKRRVLRVSQGFIAAHAVRHELWRFHPDDYGSARQYLKAAGLAASTISELINLGEYVAPFADANGISLAPVMKPNIWPRLRDGLTAMKKAVLSDDSETLQEIIDDVVKAPDRSSIREKYRTRRDPVGHACTMHLEDGRVVFIAVVDDEDAADRVAQRVGPLVVWDLVPVITKGGELRLENA